jgi:hypothetical protein
VRRPLPLMDTAQTYTPPLSLGFSLRATRHGRVDLGAGLEHLAQAGIGLHLGQGAQQQVAGIGEVVGINVEALGHGGKAVVEGLFIVEVGPFDGDGLGLAAAVLLVLVAGDGLPGEHLAGSASAATDGEKVGVGGVDCLGNEGIRGDGLDLDEAAIEQAPAGVDLHDVAVGEAVSGGRNDGFGSVGNAGNGFCGLEGGGNGHLGAGRSGCHGG